MDSGEVSPQSGCGHGGLNGGGSRTERDTWGSSTAGCHAGVTPEPQIDFLNNQGHL